MNRTTRAAIVGGLLAGGAVLLIGVFLGFDAPLSALVGIGVGIVGGGLILAAAARSRQIETRVRPRFPGPPDPPDDETDARE